MKTDKNIYNKKISEIKILESLAESGDAYAQNSIATKLAKGYFVAKNENGALYWYIQAIKQGYVPAKFNAGTMFLHGEGGAEVNLELGMQLIEDAAVYKENSACSFLAICYREGIFGKEKNLQLGKYYEDISNQLQSNIIDFSKPIDLEKEYNLKIEKPILVYKNYEFFN